MKMFHSKNTLYKVFILFIAVIMSCNSSISESSDTELMAKVNAVQKQLMKQGNISDEEKKEFLHLKTMIVGDAIFEKKTSNTSKSKLMDKIQDVKNQMTDQEKISEKERQAILSLVSLVSTDDGFDNSTDKAIRFEDVENVPIYKGCENLSKEETKECFQKSIASLIQTELNPELAENVNGSEKNSVDAFFQVDENGKITNVKVRDADVVIQAEIVNMLRKIPTMTPATQNGKNVSIICSISVPYGTKN